MTTTEEERNVSNTDQQQQEEKDHLYKTKIIQFLGRTTPIVLQNDNGPCPLLAICNVLLLRNNLNLEDTTEVSLQRLLSLVAERLIDSNSNIEDKGDGYVENQQQNIADAIDLLPRLATGIDVNIQFRRIDDFEFTRECTIFDLLDIPLYHGWIVDPQDMETASAIGSKSYNSLMGELVALETRNTEGIHKSNSEEDCIDFAAATTATLGVPSPCLSRGKSFDDSPHSVSDHHITRKGDQEEEAELLRILNLSTKEDQTSMADPLPVQINENNLPESSDESTLFMCSGASVPADESTVYPGAQQNTDQSELTLSHGSNASSSFQNDRISSPMETNHTLSESSVGSHLDSSKESEEHFVSIELMEQTREDAVGPNQSEPLTFPEVVSSSKEEYMHGPGGDQIHQPPQHDASTSSVHLEQEDNHIGSDAPVFFCAPATHADSNLTGEVIQHIDTPKGDTLSLDGSEPLYEGEDCILDTGVASYENREPMYEGEIILAEQAERGTGTVCDGHPKDISQQHGELIRNFLRNNASQLTVYGLFCLQDGLKERELCVFFRNNHFSTMFKFNGELYLLATDQGFINQPDLVWEKLNEVNGDTVFMTGNFTEFKVENHANDTWNQQNAMASTADYLSSIDNSAAASSELNSDLQLAIALQQQEFENQPQRHQNTQQSSTGTSRLITGPQVPRSNVSHSSSKQDSKPKDKCNVM